ncbi:Uncharacterised protein [Legionella lansingensis]|nr:Uncharacterised protein [Legionella lansingensis]
MAVMFALNPLVIANLVLPAEHLLASLVKSLTRGDKAAC